MSSFQDAASNLYKATTEVSMAITLIDKTGLDQEGKIRESIGNALDFLEEAFHSLTAARSEVEDNLLAKATMASGILAVSLETDVEQARNALWGALDLSSMASDAAFEMAQEIA